MAVAPRVTFLQTFNVWRPTLLGRTGEALAFSDDLEMDPQLNEVLQQEVLHFTVRGMAEVLSGEHVWLDVGLDVGLDECCTCGCCVWLVVCGCSVWLLRGCGVVVVVRGCVYARRERSGERC